MLTVIMVVGWFALSPHKRRPLGLHLLVFPPTVQRHACEAEWKLPGENEAFTLQ